MKIVAAANGKMAKWQMANGIAYLAAFAEWPMQSAMHLLYVWMCMCVCIRVYKNVALNANNICTARAKSRKTKAKKDDEAELNTKWTICKVCVLREY